jgi:hypothetical protein
MTGPAVETVAPVTETPTPAPAVATPSTPAAAPVAPATPIVPAAPVSPSRAEFLSRKDARSGLREEIAEKVTAPASAPDGQKADTPSGEAPAATPAGDTAPATPAAEPAAPAVPAATQPIRVPIPAGHPLREQGKEFLIAADAAAERDLRTLLNGTYVRRNEVTALQTELGQLQREKVEREAREATYEAWQKRPEYAAMMAKVQELRETHGDEVADLALKGFNADLEALAQREVGQRMEVVQAQEVERAAQGWKAEAWANVSTLPEPIRNLPVFPKAFEDAVYSFNAEIELGHFPGITNAEQMHQAFLRFFNTRLTGLPEVVAAVKSVGERVQQANVAAEAAKAAEQRRIEQIKKDAVEEFKKQTAASREAIPPHPLGNFTGAGRDRAGAGSQAAAPAAETSPMTRKEVRASLRDDLARLGT